MKEIISQCLLFLAEIGVIAVMLIIIVRERRKIREKEKQNQHVLKTNAVPRSQTLYLD